MPRFHRLILTVTALVLLAVPHPAQAASPASLPASWSLAGYLSRIHNQGSSNSCVAQTVATIMEIETGEFAANHPRYAHTHHYTRRGTAFSSGYVYNQLNWGNRYQWLTYSAAFRLAISQGVAPWHYFETDGVDNWWAQPGPRARHYAAKHRLAYYRDINPRDTAAIKWHLRYGHPLALLISVYSSLYNHWDGSWPVISYQYGYYLYEHSVVIVGYGPTGVEIANSWSGRWGYRGLATLTWQALRWYGHTIILAPLRDPR